MCLTECIHTVIQNLYTYSTDFTHSIEIVLMAPEQWYSQVLPTGFGIIVMRIDKGIFYSDAASYRQKETTGCSHRKLVHM